MSGYNATLKDGREIFIPSWPVDIALENLTKSGNYLGADHVVNIAMSGETLPVIQAIMESKEPQLAAALVKHFVSCVRIDGKKVEGNQIDDMYAGNLGTVAELFAHCCKAQYADFFESGLAKEPSPAS